MRVLLGLVAILCAGAIAPSVAGAAPLADQTLTASATRTASCHAAILAPGDAVRSVRVTAPVTGLLRATLRARGDWDLAVLDAGSGRFVGAGAAPAGRELAEGFVAGGEKLVVQACRRPGAGTRARLAVETIALPAQGGEREQVVTVAAPTRAARARLQALGLDLTERGDRAGVDVLLHGAADAAALVRAGFDWTVRIDDLRRRAVSNLLADGRGARRTRSAASAAVPSGRTTYRHLADYEAELKALAAAHPGLVKLIALPRRSLLGRPILGVEIAREVNVDRGQPVFLQLGLHHAREWPSAEHPMEWAYDLVRGYGSDAEITRLVDATRTIVVPVVNPDGFNLSREWPVDVATLFAPVNLPAGLGGSLPLLGDPAYDLPILAEEGVFPAPGTGFAYKRRNCRVADGRDPAPGECESLSNRRRGVDLNRNYGGFWGGPGASFDAEADDYRGAGPFSEPEVQNVRELVSAHQVTTLITNHTYSNLVLRPPGVAAAGDPPDEALYKALGDEMASKNGYVSQHGFELYDTTGSTEDWSYYATGGLGFTFEIGENEFHPPYAEQTAEYERNREAYLVALRSTANAAHHAVAEGRARPGTVLRAHKELGSSTLPVIVDVAGATAPPRSFSDVLDTTMTVGPSGSFSWHLNGSTRPGAAAPEAWTVTCERPAGTVVARGALVIARGERRALDFCSLQFTASVMRRSLGRALRLGLPVRATCSMACAASATLSIDNATARRYGLTKRRTGRVVVARGRGARRFSGAGRLGLRFTKAARARLRGARAVRSRFEATGSAASVDRRSVTRSVTLRR
ncbi:MAG TPA: M14 family zinc carboxypeptidase [Solirubrobacteraceae bacterium]|nr:M14 family zinc carboxypeptidase [Solirubrobacteraceae bacterium]